MSCAADIILVCMTRIDSSADNYAGLGGEGTDDGATGLAAGAVSCGGVEGIGGVAAEGGFSVQSSDELGNARSRSGRPIERLAFGVVPICLSAAEAPVKPQLIFTNKNLEKRLVPTPRIELGTY